jgi:hypothetical protein
MTTMPSRKDGYGLPGFHDVVTQASYGDDPGLQLAMITDSYRRLLLDDVN